MSKRKADMSPVRRPAPSSQDVLELFVHDRDAKTLRNDFMRALQQSDSAILDHLLCAMEAAGFDFSLTRAVFALPTSLHCVRCHGTYDPRKNTNTSCKTEHDDEPVMWKQKSGSGCYMYQYNCCDQTFPGYDEPPEVGFCFVGKHTTDPNEVSYGSNNVFSCEKSEICNLVDEDTKENGEESDIGSDVVEIEPPNKDNHPVKKQ
jgi:hypothetical protein